VSVCLSVFLSTHVSQEYYVRISPNVLYMLPVAVALSYSDGNEMCDAFRFFVDDVVFLHNGANGPESQATR